MAHKPKAAGKTASDAERMAKIPTDAEQYEPKQNPIRDFAEIADNVPELVRNILIRMVELNDIFKRWEENVKRT